MRKSTATRSKKLKQHADASKTEKPGNIPMALTKIFYISERTLQDCGQKLNFERFYHPGKGRATLFITKDNKQIMEILEFAEPRRCWFIDNQVCSNGHLYITTALDVTFLALHYMKKHCLTKSMSIDSIIHYDEDPNAARVLKTFVQPDLLKAITDVTELDQVLYYKYNQEKTMAWLYLKYKNIAVTLEKVNATCKMAHHTDYLRMACDYVGGYVSLDLHEELIKHLKITTQVKSMTDEKENSDDVNKRKLEVTLDHCSNKKLKLSNSGLDDDGNENANELENKKKSEINYSKNTSQNNLVKTSPTPKVTPLKRRSLRVREDLFARSAKGTKKIGSFFGKKKTN